MRGTTQWITAARLCRYGLRESEHRITSAPTRERVRPDTSTTPAMAAVLLSFRMSVTSLLRRVPSASPAGVQAASSSYNAVSWPATRTRVASA